MAPTKGMKWHRHDDLVSLPLLKITMQLCKASGEQLAKASGVSARTIDKAKQGLPIRKVHAETLAQTLKERQFSRPQRPTCVTPEQVRQVAKEGYIRTDAAHILGISRHYLRDLCEKWNIDEFSKNRSERIKIGKYGYTGKTEGASA